MTLSLASPDTFTTDTVRLTIYASDDHALSFSTWSLTVAGATATGFQLVSDGTASAHAMGVLRLAAGSGNTVTATICDQQGQCDTETGAYTYTPPPPPPDRANPVLSLAPHNGTSIVAGACAGCGDARVSYGLPPYTSLDVARSVGLVYSSAQAYPQALVQVDALDNSLTPPERMSLRLMRPDGSLVTFTAGTAEVFFRAGNGVTRLAAQFDARGLATGAYDYTAIVRSWWGSDSREASIPIRVLIVNESTSPFGWGWSMPGLQQLHFGRSDGGITLTEGDGSVAFFPRQSCDGSGNCIYTSPAGDFTELRYNSAAGTYTRRYPDGSVLTFTSTGLLSSQADRYGNTTTYTYSGSQLVQITDPAGRAVTFGYGVNGSFGAQGKLAWMRDPGGRVANLTYDPAGNVVAIQDPDGVTAFQATYTADHRIITQIDRIGAQTDIGYDPFGSVATVTAPQITTTDAGAVRPTTSFRSLAAAVLPAPGTGTGAANSAARVLPESVWVTVTPPRGATVRMRVSRFGPPTRLETRDGQGKLQVSTWEYNDFGQVTRHTTPAAGSVTYVWSGPDLIQVTDQAAGSTTAFTYETTYHQVTKISVDGVQWLQNFYGPLGRLDSTRIDTSVSRYTYDSRGRLLTASDAAGHTLTRTYETGGLQNLHSVFLSGQGTTTFAYDTYGRLQSVTNPIGQATSTTYDLLNRVTSVTQPGNVTTQYGYNDATRTYTTTDARGHTYTTVTNALGWVESQADPRGGVERFAYDRRGNLTRYTNRRGQQVQFTYDTLGRMLTRTADGQTTTFAYDTAGRWMAVANGESIDTVFADPSGRPTQAVSVRGEVRYALQATYDATGLRNALIVQGPWGQRSLGFGYDAVLRLNWLKDFSDRGTSIAYTRDQLPAQITLPTGSTSSARLAQSFTYTSAHLPSVIAYTQGVDLSLGRRYRYDGLDRVSSITRGQPANGMILRNETTRTVHYDALGRLSDYQDVHNWQEDTGNVICPDPFDLTTCYREIVSHADVLRQETYSYDAVGNRTDHGAVYETGSNRLLSFDGYSFTYDADGNVLTKSKPGVWAQSFTWNSLGELVQVVTNGVTTTYGYDGFGRRVRKTVAGVTTRYLWDGDDLVMELDGAGNPVREYAYYPGADRPHSLRRSSDGAIFYYATELPGHVTGLVNTGNQIVNWYEYTPFGEPVNTTEQVGQPLRFGARELDSETGLYYLRARYYDPHLGRFLSEDPIGLSGGINPYVYVGDDPVNGTDPSGLCPREQLIVVQNDDGTITISCPGGEAITLSVDQLPVQQLAPVVVTASPWPFATPRDQGATSNFGNPNARGGNLTGPNGLFGGAMLREGGFTVQRIGKPEHSECLNAAINLIVTGISDATFFTGVGAATRFGILAARNARLASLFVRGAEREILHRGSARQYAYLALLTASAAVGERYNLLTPGQPPSLEWQDYVPGLATGHAIVETWRACR